MHEARRFTDRFGFAWQVCELVRELPTAHLSGGVLRADAAPPHDGWLYFFSRGTTLVLRDYPRDWSECSWRELEALRERARVLGSDTTIRLAPRGAGVSLSSGGGQALTATIGLPQPAITSR